MTEPDPSTAKYPQRVSVLPCFGTNLLLVHEQLSPSVWYNTLLSTSLESNESLEQATLRLLAGVDLTGMQEHVVQSATLNIHFRCLEAPIEALWAIFTVTYPFNVDWVAPGNLPKAGLSGGWHPGVPARDMRSDELALVSAIAAGSRLEGAIAIDPFSSRIINWKLVMTPLRPHLPAILSG